MNWPCRNVTMALLFFGGVLLIAGGCSKSKVERHNLSGRVTFQGKPVPVGLIVFEPDARRGNRGPQGYAEILDGQYQTDKFGRGAVVGALNVEITGYPAQDGSAANSEAADVPLFPPYKTQVNISEDTTTLDFDVPARAK